MLFPSNLTKYKAIRSPSPVLTKPREKKNETTINQMTSLVNAAKAAAKVRVRERTEMVRQTKAQAPTGKGPRMSPATVVRKIASNCQAWFERWEGLGTAKRKIMPIARETARGMGLAPGQRRRGRGGGGGGGVEKEEESGAAREVGERVDIVVGRCGGEGERGVRRIRR